MVFVSNVIVSIESIQVTVPTNNVIVVEPQ